LEARYEELKENYDKVVTKNSQRPTLLLQGDLQMSGDTFNVGQAGAVGPNAQAHDMIFNQIGSQIEKSMNLSQLADELFFPEFITFPNHPVISLNAKEAAQTSNPRSDSRHAARDKAARLSALTRTCSTSATRITRISATILARQVP